MGLRGYVSTELDEVPSSSPGFAARAHWWACAAGRGVEGIGIKLRGLPAEKQLLANSAVA